MMVYIDGMADDQRYVMRITPGDGPMDPELAASLDEVRKATARDPNRWRNNPEKKRKALEGLGKLLRRMAERERPVYRRRNGPSQSPRIRCRRSSLTPGVDRYRPRGPRLDVDSASRVRQRT